MTNSISIPSGILESGGDNRSSQQISQQEAQSQAEELLSSFTTQPNNQKLKVDFQTFVQGALGNNLNNGQEFIRAKEYDIDGIEGLSAWEYELFLQTLEQELGRILALGDYDEYSGIREETGEIVDGAWNLSGIFEKFNIDINNAGDSISDILAEELGGLSPEKKEQLLSAAPGMDKDFGLGILIAISEEAPQMAVDILNFVSDVPNAVASMPRYLALRMQGLWMNDTEYEMRMEAMGQQSPILGLVNLVASEQGWGQVSGILKNLASSDGYTARGIVQSISALVGMAAGGAGAMKLATGAGRASKVARVVERVDKTVNLTEHLAIGAVGKVATKVASPSNKIAQTSPSGSVADGADNPVVEAPAADTVQPETTLLRTEREVKQGSSNPSPETTTPKALDLDTATKDDLAVELRTAFRLIPQEGNQRYQLVLQAINSRGGEVSLNNQITWKEEPEAPAAEASPTTSSETPASESVSSNRTDQPSAEGESSNSSPETTTPKALDLDTATKDDLAVELRTAFRLIPQEGNQRYQAVLQEIESRGGEVSSNNQITWKEEPEAPSAEATTASRSESQAEAQPSEVTPKQAVEPSESAPSSTAREAEIPHQADTSIDPEILRIEGDPRSADNIVDSFVAQFGPPTANRYVQISVLRRYLRDSGTEFSAENWPPLQQRISQTLNQWFDSMNDRIVEPAADMSLKGDLDIIRSNHEQMLKDPQTFIQPNSNKWIALKQQTADWRELMRESNFKSNLFNGSIERLEELSPANNAREALKQLDEMRGILSFPSFQKQPHLTPQKFSMIGERLELVKTNLLSRVDAQKEFILNRELLGSPVPQATDILKYFSQIKGRITNNSKMPDFSAEKLDRLQSIDDQLTKLENPPATPESMLLSSLEKIPFGLENVTAVAQKWADFKGIAPKQKALKFAEFLTKALTVKLATTTAQVMKSPSEASRWTVALVTAQRAYLRWEEETQAGDIARMRIAQNKIDALGLDYQAEEILQKIASLNLTELEGWKNSYTPGDWLSKNSSNQEGINYQIMEQCDYTASEDRNDLIKFGQALQITIKHTEMQWELGDTGKIPDGKIGPKTLTSLIDHLSP